MFKLNGEIDKELQTCRVSAIAAQRTKGSLNRVSMAPECLEGPIDGSCVFWKQAMTSVSHKVRNSVVRMHLEK